jgi:DNA-binding beta-propeller fold protein YncE
LVFGPDGNLFVSSGFSNSVLEYNGTTGAFVKTFVPTGSGGLNSPLGLVFGPNGNLFVSSRATNSVLEYNGTTGAFVTDFVPPGSGGLFFPTYLVFHSVPEPGPLTLLAIGLILIGCCSALGRIHVKTFPALFHVR